MSEEQDRSSEEQQEADNNQSEDDRNSYDFATSSSNDADKINERFFRDDLNDDEDAEESS